MLCVMSPIIYVDFLVMFLVFGINFQINFHTVRFYLSGFSASLLQFSTA